MNTRLVLALGVLAAGLAQPALAEDLLFGAEAVSAEDLDHRRGGTETTPAISNSLIQSNESELNAANTGNISVGSGGAKASGTIHQAQVTGNHGITAVMQNTGDLVNFNNATSVNVYLR